MSTAEDMRDDLSTYSQPDLVRYFAKAQQAGDSEREKAAGAEFERRRERKMAAKKAGSPKADTPWSKKASPFLQQASDIDIRPVKWMWEGRIPIGALTLLGGREELGKSTIAETIAGQVTNGTLPGEHFGKPRAVLISATEDSWNSTIVPRLIAAGANLKLVYRLAMSDDQSELIMTFPGHIKTLYEAVEMVDIAFIILDPLMSRLGTLDTHKDGEVRQALEPLVGFADSTGAALLGLIHFNKSTGVDPMTAMMGSRAFGAVARSVLMCMRDGEDSYVFGHAKNNLGRKVAAESYEIDGAKVGEKNGDAIWASKIRWTGQSARTLDEIHESSDGGVVSAVGDAAAWLDEYLRANGGQKASRIITEQAIKEGHTASTLKRARKRLKIIVTYVGSTGPNGPQRHSVWTMPEAPLEAP